MTLVSWLNPPPPRPSLGKLGHRITCAVLLAGSLLMSSAWAEKADRNKPINLEADSAVYDDAKQVMVAQGHVIVTKGTLLMRADRLEQREDRDGSQYMTATAKAGGRVFFRQKRDGLDEYMEGEAQQIEYDGKADVIRLIGKAVLRRLQGATLADESTGELIVFNNATESISLQGGDASSNKTPERVRMMLSPRNEKSTAPTPAPEPRPHAAPNPAPMPTPTPTQAPVPPTPATPATPVPAPAPSSKIESFRLSPPVKEPEPAAQGNPPTHLLRFLLPSQKEGGRP